MVSAGNVLGCGREYKVVVAWVERVRPAPGANYYNEVPLSRASLHTRGTLTGVLSVDWERTFNDVSEARITVDASCCSMLKDIECWSWEIQIYRDSERVWEGPIIHISDFSDATPATITARDVLEWFAEPHMANHMLMNFNNDDPVTIAERVIRYHLTDDYAKPPDYPLVLDYLHTNTIGDDIDYKRGQTFESVLDTLDDLSKYGLVYYAVGRRIVLSSQATTNSPIRATLKTRDFDGPVEVIQDGTDICTWAWAVRDERRDSEPDPPENALPRPARVIGRGVIGTRYGVHQGVVDMDKEASDSRMRKGADRHLQGRRRPPLSVVPPRSIRLYDCAPISITQLRPASSRVVMDVDGICWGPSGVRADMCITAVQVSWAPGGCDEVQVSFASIGQALDTSRSGGE